MIDQKKPEPDGWMMWHPEYGFDITSIAHNENLVAANWVQAEFRAFPAECKTDREKWESVKELGWQIKPVWILTKERLEELLDYEFRYKSLQK